MLCSVLTRTLLPLFTASRNHRYWLFMQKKLPARSPHPCGKARNDPISHRAVDDFKRTARAFIGVHVAGRDVEPPATQYQRLGSDLLADDRVSHQMLKLHKYIDLRQL